LLHAAAGGAPSAPAASQAFHYITCWALNAPVKMSPPRISGKVCVYPSFEITERLFSDAFPKNLGHFEIQLGQKPRNYDSTPRFAGVLQAIDDRDNRQLLDLAARDRRAFGMVREAVVAPVPAVARGRSIFMTVPPCTAVQRYTWYTSTQSGDLVGLVSLRALFVSGPLLQPNLPAELEAAAP
jgi:hypothetical protein